MKVNHSVMSLDSWNNSLVRTIQYSASSAYSFKCIGLYNYRWNMYWSNDWCVHRRICFHFADDWNMQIQMPYAALFDHSNDQTHCLERHRIHNHRLHFHHRRLGRHWCWSSHFDFVVLHFISLWILLEGYFEHIQSNQGRWYSWRYPFT